MNDNEPAWTPNRVLMGEMHPLSDDPLVGLLTLETDDGTIELAINRSVAETLKDLMEQFLRDETVRR
jgi:hypothetical protein